MSHPMYWLIKENNNMITATCWSEKEDKDDVCLVLKIVFHDHMLINDFDRNFLSIVAIDS